MTIWNMEITAAESPQTVHIPLEGKYYAIKNSGEHDILVSSSVASPTEGADDVMKIPSGSAAIIPVKDGDLYVSAEEDGAYSISIQDDKVIPWEGGTGSGGGTTHYKGTTTTPISNGSTTNPITIDGESYTAVFGDVVVYGYTEFVFDGTTWSEFGRPFDTVPTLGSTNAVTSDGIYNRTPLARSGASNTSAVGGEFSTAQGRACFAYGYYTSAGAGNTNYASAFGYNTQARYDYLFACGITNKPLNGDLFEIGNGAGSSRSNILEVNRTSANVNGDIKINNVAIPTPYTTMPTITADMLGKIAMYVGVTGNGYTQGCFYIASTDGAAEPTYSWVQIGGYREIELYSNNEHAATPVDTVITLSQDWAEFDAIGFVSEYNDEVGLCAYNEYKVSVISNKIVLNFNIGVTSNSAIFLRKNTSNSFVVNSISAPSGGLSHVYKIIGIKY